eukprot:scaffold3653_cov111-Isochrysis_galbana.AAC.6
MPVAAGRCRERGDDLTAVAVAASAADAGAATCWAFALPFALPLPDAPLSSCLVPASWGILALTQSVWGPFVEVCAEAVSRCYLCEVSTANAALMLGRSRQILAAPRHRFLVVPRTGGTLDGRVLRPGVMWVDTLDAGSVDAIRCTLPDEAWALRALQHCATNWARGEFTPKYPAISRAFLELGLLAARALPSSHVATEEAVTSSSSSVSPMVDGVRLLFAFFFPS